MPIYTGRGTKVRSFNEIDSDNFLQTLLVSLKNEIDGQSKDYILEIDAASFSEFLQQKHQLSNLTVQLDNEVIKNISIIREKVVDPWGFGNLVDVDVYEFSVSYPFSGDSRLFQVKPNPWKMTSKDIYVDEIRGIVSFYLKIYGQDANQFNLEKKSFKDSIFANYFGARAVANSWNAELSDNIKELFEKRRSQLLMENSFFESINLTVDSDTTSIFSVPTVVRIDVPKPLASEGKRFSSEPTMGKDTYDDILKVVYDSGRSMERKPSLYRNKNEEELRDQFLFILETRYRGTTAGGETFNRTGKTDIILKFADDGSNLFVAECKIWKGSSQFLEAISQIIRYLTWRDSKAALLFFVKNRDFTKVLETVQESVSTHPNFVKKNGVRGDSSFGYVFNLPQDSEKNVNLEVILFHFDLD